MVVRTRQSEHPADDHWLLLEVRSGAGHRTGTPPSVR
jgi:hypothetical protein